MGNSTLKTYTCESSKRIEQCIGVIELKNEENNMLSSSSLNSIDGQRFVASSSTQIPLNNYDKINEDQLKSLSIFQNYQKGIPSKVSTNIVL